MTHAASDLPRLDRLHRWLTLESGAGALGVAGFWLPAGPLAAGLGLAAVLFTPVLVHALWTLRRRGWLAAFVGTVGGTLLGSWALPAGVGMLRWALVLLVFYAFTWLLRLVVGEWRREAQEAAQWQSERARWAAEAEPVTAQA